jgi:hypothetical protein
VILVSTSASPELVVVVEGPFASAAIAEVLEEDDKIATATLSSSFEPRDGDAGPTAVLPASLLTEVVWVIESLVELPPDAMAEAVNFASSATALCLSVVVTASNVEELAMLVSLVNVDDDDKKSPRVSLLAALAVGTGLLAVKIVVEVVF